VSIKVKHSLGPALLVLPCVCLLIGCIPLPGNYRPLRGRLRPEEMIGPPGSGAPVELGRSTLVQAALDLGDSYNLTPDGRGAVFTYEVVTSRQLWPFSGSTPYIVVDQTQNRYLLVRFDADYRVQWYRVSKRPVRVRGD